MSFKVRFFVFITLAFSFLVLPSCLDHSGNMDRLHSDTAQKADRVLRKVRERGKIVAMLDNNSTDYFIYRGTPMGYHYEFIKQFASYLGVGLEILVSDDLDRSFEYLESGKCDVLAMGLTITKKRKQEYSFSDPIFQTKQVLVQRKRNGPGQMDTVFIESPLQLGGKVLHIQKSTSFSNRLKSLSEEIGEEIKVVEHPHANVEELIGMVASGQIDYTVADEHVATVNCMYYPGLLAGPDLSLPQNLGWAVRKDAKGLLGQINSWLAEFKSSDLSAVLYNKYFKSSRLREFASSGFFSPAGGRISDYDDIIMKYSEYHGWDWLLIASLIYQESRFDPDVTSWAGAFGLMQIMPGTARRFGIDSTATTDEQIRIGTEVLDLIVKQFADKIPDREERMKFALAAYNAGIAHVYDAQRLAEKYGKDPAVWTTQVDSFMLRKSDPEYFNDSVVKYGYCRGSETFNFVKEVMDRYDHYKNLFPEKDAGKD